jgi:uncharacterized protein YxeA
MKKKILVVITLIIAIAGISFYLLENQNLNEWDNPSDKNMYTYAIVYTQIETDILEEIKTSIKELYPFDKVGEGIFCYKQKWRNYGFIRLNFAHTKDVDLASESLDLKKNIEVILNKHNEIIIRETCIIDDKGNKY